MSVDTPIRITVAASVLLLPTLSPKDPNMKAPRGRIKRPRRRLRTSRAAKLLCSPNGGLLEWDMRARIDRNRLPRPHKYASIRPQIRLSRVAREPPPRHQQTTAKGRTVSR